MFSQSPSLNRLQGVNVNMINCGAFCMRSDSSFSMRNFLVGLAAISIMPLFLSTAAQASGAKSSSNRPAQSSGTNKAGSRPSGTNKPRSSQPTTTRPSAPAKPPASKPAAAAPPNAGNPQPTKPKPTLPEDPKPAKPKAETPKPEQPKTPAAPKPEKVTRAVTAVNPLQKKYLKHDITGDGQKETFCNWFLMDVGKEMGHAKAIPGNGQNRPANEWGKGVEKPLSANQLNAHFKNASSGWKAVTKAEAAKMANNGQFVVGSLTARGHGHVAVVIPGSTAGNMRVAQAGSTNSLDMAANKGFAYYVYTGK
jgi:hypothetical protein